MAEKDQVTLHGMWASPYNKRVELALKVKGIEYEYVEEDLTNKSSLLLQYNPVHKKIPVLVHNGKPVAESLVILEYIDETWKHSPRLLPDDPYERAKVRFWADFLQRQMFEAVSLVVKTEGEAQVRAIEQVHEKLKLLEEGIKGCLPGGSPGVNGESMGLLDIIMCTIFGPHKVQEEVLGVRFIDQEKYPLVSSWVKSLIEHPVVQELIPPHEKVVGLLRYLRENALRSSSA
ncbi:glutathione S-transferase U9-like [Punica granatum]|uniref:Glutathione S-transferase n=2 Tax=Punica granatum TaxID=22663 RepID=A0A218VZ51_PUNGR|nr:glutathione S-transferase U9-like [Punica granatum]OWM65301.1 hypothetical protein CDL15_Pgr008891 [Punica granatum]PKI63249.1 hypothetical protein CRG98_016434 [Punica granatum]